VSKRGFLLRHTIEFDHHSREMGIDPYPVYERLRRECPVAYSEAWGGFWVVSDYEHVAEISRDDETFRSGEGISIPVATSVRIIPGETDPPDSKRYRSLLNPRLTPSAIEATAHVIRRLADRQLDLIKDSGRADLAVDVAQAVPAFYTGYLMGFDESQVRFLLARVHEFSHEVVADHEKAGAAMTSMLDLLAEQVAERRKLPADDRDDLISYVCRVECDGRRLSDDEVLRYLQSLVLGGLDTTAALLTHAFHYLGGNQAAQARLREHPDEIPRAVEEFLRHSCPAQALSRTVSAEVEVGGQKMMPGDKVLLLWGSASRDEKEFDRADEVVLDREVNRHLAFGVGSHRCMGSNVARTVARITIEAVLEAIPGFELAADAEPEYFADASIIYGMKNLPVTFPIIAPRVHSDQSPGYRID